MPRRQTARKIFLRQPFEIVKIDLWLRVLRRSRTGIALTSQSEWPDGVLFSDNPMTAL